MIALTKGNLTVNLERVDTFTLNGKSIIFYTSYEGAEMRFESEGDAQNAYNTILSGLRKQILLNNKGEPT